MFTGDCLYVLNGMNSESVDLIYLDPPFNSKRFYSAPIGSKAAGASFKDMWSWKDVDEAYLERMVNDYPYLVQYIEAVEILHSKAMMAYLTYMTQRILEMHRVLKPTGSLYLHCDQTASHYLKIICDRVFGKNNFLNEILWCYRTGGASKRFFGRKHDVILFYSKSKKYNFNIPQDRSYLTGQLRHSKKNKTLSDEHGTYQNILFSKTNIKLYKDERGYYTMTGCRDYWNMDAVGRTSKERLGYPTQKPLALLERIIKASSNKGNVVLDPFCGCATTMVAAQQLQRRWIGIDIEKKSAELVVDRLSDEAGLFKDFVHRTDVPIRTDIEITDIVDAKNKKQVKKRLGKEYGKICNACGMDNYENLEIDHIVPKNKGGQDTYGNYQLLCGNCNRIKGDRPMDYLMAKIAAREKLLKRKITFGRKTA